MSHYAKFLLLILLLIGGGLWLFANLFSRLLTPPKDLAPDQPIKIQPLPALSGQQQQSFDYLNQLRQSVDLVPFQYDPLLEKTAQFHADYSSHNNQQGHTETPGLVLFSGESPNDRAKTAGYSTLVNEVISYNKTSTNGFIDDLMSALYHRLTLLSMDQDTIGIRISDSTNGEVKNVLVAETSNQKLAELCQQVHPPKPGELFYKGVCHNDQVIAVKDYRKALSHVALKNPKLLVWPAEGATIPPVFYEENPDPLPNCNVSGYPPHIQINPVYQGRIEFLPDSFQLFEWVNGQRIRVETLTQFTNLEDPNRQTDKTEVSNKHQWYALFPAQRLNWNSHYQAQVQYQENGQVTTHRWSFLTPKQPGLVVLNPNSQAKVPIKIGQTRTLYFPPNHCQAPQKAHINTSSSPHVQLEKSFIDGQTFQIKLLQARKGDVIALQYSASQYPIYLKVE